MMSAIYSKSLRTKLFPWHSPPDVVGGASRKQGEQERAGEKRERIPARGLQIIRLKLPVRKKEIKSKIYQRDN